MRQAEAAEGDVPTKVVANIAASASSRCPCPILGLERAYAERCSDNSSIMQTVERLLTNAVKRFVGHIGDLALPTETAGSATPNA